eukprot:CAMPEP_0184319150 /NCGR_PEP_ID=MMETSP1049-20130417/106758_1 /TAXON_ID=77928 /ORGANISM="Proteomonas sulcata, Strain CCMP704" /LENGTH=145 /DNA_ID=CAMNT_0026639169 /DNA_START=210 /DNA_END=644 /DNA_ORIENTATION=+
MNTIDSHSTSQDLAAKLKAGLNSWSPEEQEDPGSRPAKGKGKKKKIPIKPAKGAATARGEKPKEPVARADMKVRVETTDAGRKGKKVTLIKGIESLPKDEAKALVKKLKTAISVGGKVSEDGEVEIQGEHAEFCAKVLKQEGFKD